MRKMRKYDWIKETEGKYSAQCACCGDIKFKYKRGFSSKLASTMKMIGDYCKRNNITSFHVEQITSEHKKLANFHHLCLWGLIERKKENGYWNLTENGYKFLNKLIKIHEYCWEDPGPKKPTEEMWGELINIDQATLPNRDRDWHASNRYPTPYPR